MSRRVVIVPIVGSLLTLVAGFPARSVVPACDYSIVLGDAAPFVMAFLHQQTREIDGLMFTASVFADREENGLTALGMKKDARAERVRIAVERDFAEHRTEYWARSHIAQARARRRPDSSVAKYQDALWAVFLSDARYVQRLAVSLSAERDEAHEPGRVAIPSPRVDLLTTIDEASTLHATMKEALEDLSSKRGCDARSLTIFGRIPEADPLLAADLFEILQSARGRVMSVEEVLSTLRSEGWEFVRSQ